VKKNVNNFNSIENVITVQDSLACLPITFGGYLQFFAMSRSAMPAVVQDPATAGRFER